MTLSIGSTAPDFEQDSTQGRIKFHDWIGDSWAILFSHPKDYTPVCTTELGTVAGMKSDFDKRNTKLIGLSVDPVSDHEGWSKDIEEVTGNKVTYPLLADSDLSVAKLYNMLPAGAGDSAKGRTAVDNLTVRSVYVIGPDKQIKAMLTYPMSTGRNFDEILRLLDSCQLTAKHKVATPANWNQGEDVIIVPAVKDEEAKERFPDGWKTVKPYLRVVPQPKG
jgi:alkyl hydroperoxide reductase subunit AhpC